MHLAVAAGVGSLLVLGGALFLCTKGGGKKPQAPVKDEKVENKDEKIENKGEKMEEKNENMADKADPKPEEKEETAAGDINCQNVASDYFFRQTAHVGS